MERQQLDREKRDNAHTPQFNTVMFLIEIKVQMKKKSKY